jgi:GntR family transcriptional regulator
MPVSPDALLKPQLTSQLTPAKPLPLFLRLAELLARGIAAGHYQAGERLPPESELSLSLSASVGTVRKALALLESRGLLERKQGSGTYVRGREPAQAASASRSIYEFFRLELETGGGLPSALLIDLKKVRKPAAVPAFGEGVSATVSPTASSSASPFCYRVRRLRFLNDTPVAVEEIWFDARHREHLRIEQLDEALYHFYETELGFWISHAEDRLKVGSVPDWSPAQFQLAPGQACCKIERKAWSSGGSLEEFSNTWVDTRLAHYVARWS